MLLLPKSPKSCKPKNDLSPACSLVGLRMVRVLLQYALCVSPLIYYTGRVMLLVATNSAVSKASCQATEITYGWGARHIGAPILHRGYDCEVGNSMRRS